MVEQKRKHTTLKLINGQEIRVNHLTKQDVNRKLANLEAKYGMTSREFVGKWNRGKLDCAVMDYFLWTGYCRMAYKHGRVELQVED